MGSRSKLLLAALTTTAVMSFAVSTASARRFEVSEQRFRAIWTLLNFEVSGTATIQCPVTLEGSFHSKILSKVSGQLIGYITRAFVRGDSTSCLNTGTARVNAETLPWHVQYLRFIGSLPAITEIEIQLVGADFNVDPASIFLPNCRARTEQLHPAKGIILLTSGSANRLRANENARIPLPGICEFAEESNFSGTAEVFGLGSTTTRITVRLVQ
jgi:hypothetical protein